MKANDGSGNIPERDEWETPVWLFNNLDKQYHFDVDLCANSENTKVINSYPLDFLKFTSGTYMSWMNPPFSKAKEMFIHFFDSVQCGVAIYRCDNLETDIWQNVIFPNCSWIFIPNKRIVYDGLNGNGARFPSALIGLNVDPPKYIDGICLKKG